MAGWLAGWAGLGCVDVDVAFGSEINKGWLAGRLAGWLGWAGLGWAGIISNDFGATICKHGVGNPGEGAQGGTQGRGSTC